MSDTVRGLLSLGILVGLVMAWVCTMFLAGDSRDKRNSQLIKVTANGWTWCGSQRAVNYKTSSVSIETADGQYTFYGDISVIPVTSCEQQKAKP